MVLFMFLGHYVHQCRAYSYSSIPPLVLSVVSYKEPQQFRHHTQCVNNFASIFLLQALVAHRDVIFLFQSGGVARR